MNIKYRLWSHAAHPIHPHEVVRDPKQLAEFFLTENTLPCIGARLCFPPKGAFEKYDGRAKNVRFKVIDVYVHYQTVEEMRNIDGAHHECSGSLDAEVDAIQEYP